jgi:hypothetical protein
VKRNRVRWNAQTSACDAETYRQTCRVAPRLGTSVPVSQSVALLGIAVLVGCCVRCATVHGRSSSPSDVDSDSQRALSSLVNDQQPKLTMSAVNSNRVPIVVWYATCTLWLYVHHGNVCRRFRATHSDANLRLSAFSCNPHLSCKACTNKQVAGNSMQ